jgi:Peptidase family M28/PA domain
MRHWVPGLGALSIVGGLLCQTAAPIPQRSRLLADLEFLTSDALAGRVSLSLQAEISARYIAADFQRSGLAPAGGSYLQAFPLIAYRSDPGRRALTLHRAGAEKTFRPGVDFTGAFSRDLDLKAPIVFVRYGITAPEYDYDDYAGVDATGKIALMFDHEPEEDDPTSRFNGTGQTLHAGRMVKVTNARRHGAVAVLIASEPIRRHPGLLDPAPRGANQGQPLRASAPPQSLEDPGQIPAFSIADTVLVQLLGSNQPAELDALRPKALPDTVVEIRGGNSEQRRGTSYNAVGLWEGSDPALKSETVLMTAHYDHLGVQNGRLYPGANDNASGTVAVMELARLFAANATRPKRSLLFVVFGSEEQLMLGSFYYTAHPLRPLAGTRAVLNLDMIGRDEQHIPQSEGALEIPADTSNRLNLVGAYYSPDLLSILERADRQVGLTLDTKFDRDHTLNALFRCDHLPFLLAGVPAVWLFGGFHPGYHEPSDTVEKLNLTKMEKVIQLAYAAALDVANSPAPPRFGPR